MDDKKLDTNNIPVSQPVPAQVQPQDQNQPPSPNPTPPPSTQPTNSSVKRILLVEDEEPIRELYKRQLELAGFQVDAFGIGKDALTAVSQKDYDLLLLDIMLPDINGLQILKEVKANDRTKNISVLMLTNLGQDITIKEGFDLGAEGYLIKASYTPDQIIEEINNILLRKQAQPI